MQYIILCICVYKIVKKGVLFRLDDVSSRNMCVKRAFLVFCLSSQLAAYSFYNTQE